MNNYDYYKCAFVQTTPTPPRSALPLATEGTQELRRGNGYSLNRFASHMRRLTRPPSLRPPLLTHRRNCS